MFSEDVSDAEPGEARAAVIVEKWIFGQRAVAPFRQHRTKNFGCLRPQWANTFLASLAKQANVRRSLELDIKHTHRDYLLNSGACIEHCGEEGVITTAIGGSPVNCGQHCLNLIEFEVFDRTGTRSLERYCQNPLT
jgi:hypothetical protein